jgi:hypothetical protein
MDVGWIKEVLGKDGSMGEGSLTEWIAAWVRKHRNRQKHG